MPRTSRWLHVTTLAAMILPWQRRHRPRPRRRRGGPRAAAAGPQRAGRDDEGEFAWRLSRLPDLRFRDNQPSDAAVVTVDDGTRYQRFTGVGAAMTDSSAWLIYDELHRAPVLG